MAELVSTRDPDCQIVSYQDALLAGLAPDRGLYMPEGPLYPKVSTNELRELIGKSYAERATFVKNKLIGEEIDYQTQGHLNEAAYNPDHFPTAKDNIAPVVEIGDNLAIQNLSGGPTAAFKDFGLRSLAQEMDYALNQKGKDQLEILGATSGDTASAAEAAFKTIRRVSMFMLSPLGGGMTPFQRAQIGLLSDSKTHNLSYEGSFDDCQDMVKDVQEDEEFADLGAVNSINWGRVVAQVAYYFDAYLQAVGDNIGQEVDFVVPTGNFGNVLSGHIARGMGLPIRYLIVATI